MKYRIGRPWKQGSPGPEPTNQLRINSFFFPLTKLFYSLVNLTPYAARDSSVVHPPFLSSQQCPNVVNVTRGVENETDPIFNTALTHPLLSRSFPILIACRVFFYAKKGGGEVIKKKFRATPLSLFFFLSLRFLEQISGILEISKRYLISRKVWESSTFYFQNCFGYFFRIIFFQARLWERKDVIVSSLSRNEEKGEGNFEKPFSPQTLFLFTTVISHKSGEKFFFARRERKWCVMGCGGAPHFAPPTHPTIRRKIGNMLFSPT